jgi:hypothetical protein
MSPFLLLVFLALGQEGSVLVMTNISLGLLVPRRRTPELPPRENIKYQAGGGNNNPNFNKFNYCSVVCAVSLFYH